MAEKAQQVLGLCMTGGGARGAYQAGVLKRISEIPALRDKPSPFRVVGGASAGAINSVGMAVGAENFTAATYRVCELWGSIRPKNVFRTDFWSLTANAARWIRDLTFGGLVGAQEGNRYLLDARPLKDFLSAHIDFSLIQRNIDQRHLDAVVIAGTNYSTGKTYFFIQGNRDHKTWIKSRRVALDATLTADHICASSAIPILFGPVALNTQFGEAYFGDGCLRLPQPLSPVIRLGAEKILAIGVASSKSLNNEKSLTVTSSLRPPSLAQVLGVCFNAIFLDHLDTDVEHTERLNRLIAAGAINNAPGLPEGIRPIEVLKISPSVDIGDLAESYKHHMPFMVRYLLKGLGTKIASSSDLMSYILLDLAFTRTLIDIGYKDAQNRIEEIEEFLRA